MPVYVIGSDQGDVKIGFAANPWLRLVKLRSDNAIEVRLLAVIPGDREVEANLHARFASERTRGEWFKRTPEIEALIGTNEPPVRHGRRPPKSHPIEAYRRRHHLRLHHLAERLGVSGDAVGLWIRGKRSLNAPTIRAIVEATGGEITVEELVFWPDEPPASRERRSLYVVGALGEAA